MGSVTGRGGELERWRKDEMGKRKNHVEVEDKGYGQSMQRVYACLAITCTIVAWRIRT